MFQTAVYLISSIRDSWLSLAIILQLYDYIAKEDDKIFSSALCGLGELIMTDCMALSPI